MIQITDDIIVDKEKHEAEKNDNETDKITEIPNDTIEGKN